MKKTAYKLVFYVPVENAEFVKDAVFNAGAGKLGNYECCCFESVGIGQFRPLSGSSPTIGNINEVTKVNEVKVEMICPEDSIKTAIEALKKVHPYEEVALQFWKVQLNL